MLFLNTIKAKVVGQVLIRLPFVSEYLKVVWNSLAGYALQLLHRSFASLLPLENSCPSSSNKSLSPTSFCQSSRYTPSQFHIVCDLLTKLTWSIELELEVTRLQSCRGDGYRETKTGRLQIMRRARPFILLSNGFASLSTHRCLIS